MDVAGEGDGKVMNLKGGTQIRWHRVEDPGGMAVVSDGPQEDSAKKACGGYFPIHL